LWSTLERDNPIEIRPGDERIIRYNQKRGMFVEYGMPEKSRFEKQFERDFNSDRPDPDAIEKQPGDAQPPSIRELNERQNKQNNSEQNDGRASKTDNRQSRTGSLFWNGAGVAALTTVSNINHFTLVSWQGQNQDEDQDEDQDKAADKKQEKHSNGDGKPSTSKPPPQDDTPLMTDPPLMTDKTLGTGQDGDGKDSDDSDDEAAESSKKQSVPGAPVRVRVTQFGIVIESDDHEAAYDLEKLILDVLQDSSSLIARPGAFRLNHRDVLEAEALLKQMLGLATGGGGGGGGGGLGGLLGGAMSNAVGGAAGDMLGGLLGGGGFGGGGSSGAIYVPEGDVAIVADAKTQTLYVSASGVDMEHISLIIREIDREEGPHGPNILGESYLIFIEFRDPTEIAEIIRQNMKGYLNEAEKSGGGNNQAAAQARAQAEMLKAITGGRGGRGGGSNVDPEASKPKASMSVDENRSALVVTGPYSIYQDIKALAKLLDQPGADANHTFEFLQLEVAGPSIESSLRSAFGDKIVFTSDSSNGQANTTPKTTTNTGNRTPTRRTNNAGRQTNAGNAEAAMRSAVMNQMRAMRRGNGGGNRRTNRTPQRRDR